MKHKAFIALGSNLSNPRAQVEQAIQTISSTPSITLVSASSLHETKPVGYADQPDFINAVVMIQTELSALALFETLQAIEQHQGRVRHFKNGPRVIDLDLILYDDATIQTETLTVPHPRMMERAFVLKPLLEIAPDCRLPSGEPVDNHSHILTTA